MILKGLDCFEHGINRVEKSKEFGGSHSIMVSTRFVSTY